jgi:hypothetical protein
MVAKCWNAKYSRSRLLVKSCNTLFPQVQELQETLIRTWTIVPFKHLDSNQTDLICSQIFQFGLVHVQTLRLKSDPQEDPTKGGEVVEVSVT